MGTFTRWLIYYLNRRMMLLLSNCNKLSLWPSPSNTSSTLAKLLLSPLVSLLACQLMSHFKLNISLTMLVMSDITWYVIFKTFISAWHLLLSYRLPRLVTRIRLFIITSIQKQEQRYHCAYREFINCLQVMCLCKGLCI